MQYTIFDLMAKLLSILVKWNKPFPKNTIEKSFSDDINKESYDLVYNKISKGKIVNCDKKCVSSQSFNDIINTCKDKDMYIFYRAVLCHLDMLVNIDDIISKYNCYNFGYKNVEKVFESLNNNSDDTGIIVIPKIPVYENTIQINGISKSYKNADYWYDNLNEHFNNIIYIQKDRMKGFSLKNVIVDIISNQHDDKIKIGFTPGCNLALDEIMKVRTYCDPNTKEQLFEIQDYYKEELLNKQFLNSLNLAKENDVDILVGSEMFGTSLLCETDEFGFNLQYKDPSSRKPYIIVTPTYWNNRKNYASVFLNSGEQIGLQYKQNGFEYRCNDTKFTENLENTPKEIMLLHIPRWGRITIPICVDYLVSEYRDILIKELKTTIMLCPSYSSGTIQFDNAASAGREFGVKTLWLNTCSALSNHKKISSIGFVSTPIITLDEKDTMTKEIIPTCSKCLESCLFTIDIQLKGNDVKKCNEVNIKHVPQ